MASQPRGKDQTGSWTSRCGSPKDGLKFMQSQRQGIISLWKTSAQGNAFVHSFNHHLTLAICPVLLEGVGTQVSMMNIPSHESYHLTGGHKPSPNKSTRISPIVINATMKINHGGNTHDGGFVSRLLLCEQTLIWAPVCVGRGRRTYISAQRISNLFSYLVWTLNRCSEFRKSLEVYLQVDKVKKKKKTFCKQSKFSLTRIPELYFK